MLEDVIFGQIAMPGEAIRILVALLGVCIAAYFDIYKQKNIPDQFLQGFLAVAFILNLILFQSDLFWFSIAIALFFSAVGYIFYRLGQLGGADVFILASVMLLIPIVPSFSGMSFNIPFVFPVIIFSGIAFAIYVMGYYGYKLSQGEVKPKLVYALMLIPYLLFAYVYVNSFLFSAVYFMLITILLLATIFFLMFRDQLNGLLSEVVPVAKLEPEDVLALEVMNKDLVERYKLPRLMTQGAIDKLKKTKVTEVSVYTKLPPFVPFILLGMLLSLLFAKSLLLL